MDNTIDFKTVGAEVYEVLRNIPKEEYYKVPREITDAFKAYKDETNQIKIDFNKSFQEQEISQTAKDIIYLISLNYWLTEDDRQKILKKMEMNEEKSKKKL